ncbi:hypothetical protein BGW80DRAFT_1288124 [Lactifluus volemus]|nr:hypothetical protein BGW80DRAFT_1288124 [Lactifluus volemus]
MLCFRRVPKHPMTLSEGAHNSEILLILILTSHLTSDASYIPSRPMCSCPGVYKPPVNCTWRAREDSLHPHFLS